MFILPVSLIIFIGEDSVLEERNLIAAEALRD